MKKLGARGMKVLWLFHIIFMVVWMGGIISYLSILLAVNKMGEGGVYGAYSSIHAIDIYLIRNGALGLLVTGILYSVLTKWGFFKHRWITVKWIVMLFQIVLGAVYLGSRLDANMLMVKESTNGILSNPNFIKNHNTVIMGCAVQISILVFIIIISKLKPWARRKAA